MQHLRRWSVRWQVTTPDNNWEYTGPQNALGNLAPPFTPEQEAELDEACRVGKTYQVQRLFRLIDLDTGKPWKGDTSKVYPRESTAQGIVTSAAQGYRNGINNKPQRLKIQVADVEWRDL